MSGKRLPVELTLLLFAAAKIFTKWILLIKLKYGFEFFRNILLVDRLSAIYITTNYMTRRVGE